MSEQPQSLRDLYRERNYLEYNYQHLRIKTIDYIEEKKRINKEIDEIVFMDEKDLRKKERSYKKKKTTKVDNLVRDIFKGKRDSSRILSDDVDNVRS